MPCRFCQLPTVRIVRERASAVPHLHLIPRHPRDTPDPRGGVLGQALSDVPKGHRRGAQAALRNQ